MTSQDADERRIRALLVRMGVGPQADQPHTQPATRSQRPARHRPAAAVAVDACSFLVALQGLLAFLT